MSARLRSALARPEISDWSLASYRAERRAHLLLPPAMAVIQGGFVGVIADKVFAVHPAVLSLLTAAPMFANLSSAYWASLAQRLRKVPLLVGLQVSLGVGIAVAAAMPATSAGAIGLVAAIVATHLLLSGYITVRSVVWTMNYADHVRGRVTSRLTNVSVLGMAFVSWAGSVALDADASRYRAIFLGAAALAGLSALAYARVRMRGEEKGAVPIGAPEEGERTGLVRLLRDDPLYARYLACQFLLGLSNMAVEAPLVLLVSRELGANYQVSVGLTVVLPLVLSVLTIPFWAGYIDRVHITRFRSRHSWLWVASLLLTFVGAYLGSLLWIGIGRVVLGLARGGGMLAWTLGHNDFARPERAGLYMGLHATLTGLRGAIAPFLGMAIYVGWDVPLPGVPAFAGLGAPLWLLAAGTSVMAILGFMRLARRVEARV
ncbi:MAG: MFS transporter [Myxococcota bacterium]|nr:MFS transporter [Myxococcota bacterium]